MTSVLVLFVLFCGVYTASIPDSDTFSTQDITPDGKLDGKLDSKLDGLDSKLDGLDSKLDGLDAQTSDNIKQTVLEGVKKLLDSQLAALVRDKDRYGREGNNRISKTRSSSILTSKPREKIQDFSSSDEQNSKTVNEDSVQDPSVDALSNAVDELLKENKDIILEDKDEIILDNNVDNIIDLENSKNIDNDGIISQDEYNEIASQLFKQNEKDRKGKKSQITKQKNRVIVNRLPKINEKDKERNKFEDNLEEKSNKYDEKVKTRTKPNDEQDDSKRFKYNKKRKNQIELSENGKNLGEYNKRLDQLKRKENETEANKNQNINLIHPTYRRGQKYSRRLNSRNKNPNKYRRNGNRHIYYKLPKNLKPHTVTSNNDARKNWYNDLIGKNLKHKSVQNEVSNLGIIKKKHETSNVNDSVMSTENANNNEETDIFTENKDEIKDKMGKEKDSGNEDKTSVTQEKENNTSDKNHDSKVKGTRKKTLRKENQIETDEIKGEKRIFQESEDKPPTDTRGQVNDVTVQEGNISENEEDITEIENITSETENVAREAKDEKETDKDYILDFLENTQNTDTDKNITKDKHTKKDDMSVSKKDVSRNCRHESDESRILRDLFQNNDIKKSFSFSLNFTSQ